MMLGEEIMCTTNKGGGASFNARKMTNRSLCARGIFAHLFARRSFAPPGAIFGARVPINTHTINNDKCSVNPTKVFVRCSFPLFPLSALALIVWTLAFWMFLIWHFLFWHRHCFSLFPLYFLGTFCFDTNGSDFGILNDPDSALSVWLFGTLFSVLALKLHCLIHKLLLSYLKRYFKAFTIFISTFSVCYKSILAQRLLYISILNFP